MQANAEQTQMNGANLGDVIPRMFQGFRFSLCDTPEQVAEALDIRRRVYVQGVGYSIPVPDQYDVRSWFLLAEDMEAEIPVGCMRITPRFAGPFESEEYFTLPKPITSSSAVELNRFAILPEYRKGKTFLPVVSLGLFKTVMTFLKRLGTDYMVAASKPERVFSYEWMGFRQTGLSAPYGKLDYSEHQLLAHDFYKVEKVLEGHPFKDFFCSLNYSEVVIPKRIPLLGLGTEEFAASLRQKSA
jgi:N-acyl-L-homoserine lactone synthetase